MFRGRANSMTYLFMDQYEVAHKKPTEILMASNFQNFMVRERICIQFNCKIFQAILEIYVTHFQVTFGKNLKFQLFL